METPSDATRLLERAQGGDDAASNELFVLLQAELRALAGELMGSERAAHTLQPTALINEAWLKLFAGESKIRSLDRAHFVRTIARAMRRILVDHARARRRVKRDAGRVEALDVTLAAVEAAQTIDPLEIVALDEALQCFAEFDPAGARVVELRFFCGLTNDQVAENLGVSVATVERTWHAARLWLSRALHGADGGAT